MRHQARAALGRVRPGECASAGAPSAGCFQFAEDVETVFQIPSRTAPQALFLCMERAFPGAILTMNTAGDFLGWQPHEEVSCRTVNSSRRRRSMRRPCMSYLKPRSSRCFVKRVSSATSSWTRSGHGSTQGVRCVDRPSHHRHEKDRTDRHVHRPRAGPPTGRLVLYDGPQLKFYAKGTQPDRDIRALFEPDPELLPTWIGSPA